MPAVKDVGEPCAGEPHARFDGRVEETHHAPEGLHQQEGDLPARQSMMARAAQTGAGSAPPPYPTNLWPYPGRSHGRLWGELAAP